MILVLEVKLLGMDGGEGREEGLALGKKEEYRGSKGISEVSKRYIWSERVGWG